MRFSKRMHRIILFFSLILPIFGYCNTTNSDEGIFIVKLIGVKKASSYNAKWNSISVANKQNGSEYSFRDSAPFGVKYSVFTGTLPKGQYVVSGVQADGVALTSFGVIPALISLGMTSAQQDFHSGLGTFTIAPRGLTNLGVIVSSIPEGKEEKLETVMISDSVGQASVLADIDEQTRSRVEGLHSRSWDSTQDSTTVLKALDIARKFNYDISTLEVAADRRIIIGSALGMIHIRNHDGSWTHTSTGTLDYITYVRTLDDGRIFAASDNGKYFVSTVDHKAWHQFRLLGDGYRIYHLEPMGKHGFAFSVGTTHKASLSKPYITKLIFKNRLEDPAAKEVLSVNDYPSFGRRPFYDGSELRIYFPQIGFTRTSDLYRINPITQAQLKETVNFLFIDIYRLPEGTLVIDRMNGMSRYNSFSDDNGKTWKDGDVPTKNSARFMNSQIGYTLDSRDSGHVLAKTIDGGQTWVPIGNPLKLTVNWLIPIRYSDNQIFIFTTKNVYSTQNEGKTWKNEWPVQQSF